MRFGLVVLLETSDGEGTRLSKYAYSSLPVEYLSGGLTATCG